MKNRFYVKKRTLLLIAGVVWLLAGFNVARMGILSYLMIDTKWYLFIFSMLVFYHKFILKTTFKSFFIELMLLFLHLSLILPLKI